ncbi:GrpB domain, predicted nucleotidyltransferase, UPF0157 family [Chitinophaga costaii]|uniref:GrpB domain, predicted nucleotidyltransferase, UPF0157 family n=1 Tax=Chitinophaga costaii TaxID=1335309 RepID=A0A1C4FMD6_9BACT|nr:GrpB family protein [Chitinophaga costaii]PUZ29938.1 GrpB family protein [Chitinophaga costaii]SCC57138.1 GrpB domain, predicted nucleotidyltransferase, UPF0157 family [Chitinophaga costaii]
MHTSPHENSWPVWATEPIVVVDHDPSWAAQAMEEIHFLQPLLSPFGNSGIWHIGSTAVQGLCAKPVLDLVAPIASLNSASVITRILSPYHWHYVPYELDQRPWRRFYIKVQQNKRIAHLHLVLPGEARWHEQLRFRDILQDNAYVRQAYAALKSMLAEEYRHDLDAYAAAKSDFIRKTLKDY